MNTNALVVARAAPRSSTPCPLLGQKFDARASSSKRISRITIKPSRVIRRSTAYRRRATCSLSEASNVTGSLAQLAQLVPSAAYERLFDFENVAFAPFWLLMGFAPAWEVTKKTMSSYVPLLLGSGIYIYLAVGGLSDPQALEGFSTGKPDLAALTSAFSIPSTVAVGWAHFIAQDLFVGRWIYFDGMKNKVFFGHSLFLCAFFGPTGILSHVLTRAVTGAVRGDDSIQDIISGSLEDV